jgi:hypothetical protein
LRSAESKRKGGVLFAATNEKRKYLMLETKNIFNLPLSTGNLAGLGGSLNLSIVAGGSAITFQRAAVVPKTRDHRFSSNISGIYIKLF